MFLWRALSPDVLLNVLVRLARRAEPGPEPQPPSDTAAITRLAERQKRGAG